VTYALRVFFVGGLMSYRALFGWLSPWILVPSFLVAPLFQILLFAYVGRAAGLESDEFYVLGNAIQYAAIPCLFAMGNTIGGERWQQTLPLILGTPAPRLPLFLGRALPVVVNGFFVSAFALVTGSLLLGVRVPLGAVAPIAVAVAVSALSCTGLGLVNAALGLRVREVAVLSNVIFGVLLVFCGVNVSVGDLPGWMQPISAGLPLTHGIEAARRLADGAAFGRVAGLLGTELAIGAAYMAVGYVLLRFFETMSRRHATLDRA
jgi:ABC-2 type transport system permease protein